MRNPNRQDPFWVLHVVRQTPENVFVHMARREETVFWGDTFQNTKGVSADFA